MGVFEMVTIIVVIGCVTGMVTSYFESKAKSGGKDRSAKFDAMNARLKQSDADVEMLKGRVRVLERLVTDDDRKLASEIDRLGARERV